MYLSDFQLAGVDYSRRRKPGEGNNVPNIISPTPVMVIAFTVSEESVL